MVLRLLTTLAAEKRTFLPAIAAGGGDGRQEGNSWVAEIDGSCQTLYHRDKPGGDKARENEALKMIMKVKVALSNTGCVLLVVLLTYSGVDPVGRSSYRLP